MSRSELINIIFDQTRDGLRGFTLEGEHQVFLNDNLTAVLERLSVEQLSDIHNAACGGNEINSL